ncbi:hypothetical protein M422DRAFT_228721 [Sphaerobolus stellatus SS14]|uniref:Inosine/uridine-preferring nucleoside hydrolase domain-containing protein n=1 Tax=Sphaerobolus stellatus (strain SS14) TaxID=990650 RepID=A0A0C9VAT7_SPHS4|nr:hypothetical protein M422DRAFT_228721 [Sphaerobolus stellatus SS14]
MPRAIWLDCDPGHDDAIAILLALNSPEIKLLGISTVHGNTTPQNAWKNALRLTYAFGTEGEPKPKVYAGATKPLLRTPKVDAEIHGLDGLGGVEGLTDFRDPKVQRLAQETEGKRAVEAIAAAVQETWKNGEGERVTLVTTGPQTNLALFLSVYVDLQPAIEEIVFMGGAVGVGNRGPLAEYNILCDPEASQIVLDYPIPKVMIPINATHQVIFTKEMHYRLLAPDQSLPTPDVLPLKAATPLRHTISTFLLFFADTYRSTFGFNEGPPLHDALTIAYIVHPELFRCKRYRVDVELSGTHALGATVVDVWNYRTCDDTWGYQGKNCLVAEDVNVPGFFDYFLECIERCDKKTPLNIT